MNPPPQSLVPAIPMRMRPKPEYMRRGDVWKLCQRNRIGKHKFSELFGPECSARVYLTKGGRALYVRSTVLALLGLKDE